MAHWETRPGGRRYLYRTFRRDGRVVREYVGRGGWLGDLQAETEAILRHDRAAARQCERAKNAAVGWRAAAALKLAAAAPERDAAAALLLLVGFRRHKRGEWRMAGGIKKLRKQIDELEAKLARRPLVHYGAPAGDAEAIALFAAARAGDAAAVAKLPALIAARGWGDWIGDVGRQATHQLKRAIARDDPVLLTGLDAKTQQLWNELAGPNPTTLETLLVRRIVNSWLALHAVEIEYAASRDVVARRKLAALVGGAQRRMTSAVRELATVRRLQAPALVARIEVAARAPEFRQALPAGG